MSKVYDYIVTSKEVSIDTTLIVSLRSQSKRRRLSFRPGQYAAISFLHNGRPTASRCFSIISSPADNSNLEFAIHSSSDFQEIANASLLPGTRVMLEGPYGELIFNSERDISVLMIAEGIGVAPFIGILRYAAQKQLKNDLFLMYHSERQDNMPFLSVLHEMDRVNPHLTIKYAISSANSNLMYGENILRSETSGTLLDQVIPSGTHPEKTVFLSGSPSFTNKVTQELLASGSSIESIIAENIEHGQVGPRTISHKVSLQVYALTGLSLVLGTAAALPRVASVDMASLSSGSVNSAPKITGSNSRQTTVNQTINKLIASGSDTTTSSNSGTSNSPNKTVATSSTTASSSTKSTSPSSTTPSSTSKGPTSSTTSSTTASSSTKSTSPSSTTPSSTSSSGSTSGGTSSSGTSNGGSSETVTTPKPTPVAPNLTFSSSTTSITSGQSVTLSWSVNSTATTPVTCSASDGWSGSKGSSGSASVRPSSTTTYSLTCSNSTGSSSHSVTVTVAPACVSTASNPC